MFIIKYLSIYLIQSKTSTWSAVNFKKHVISMSSKLESAIWSCDTGQWIPCFHRCQLIITWMSNIKEVQDKPKLHMSLSVWIMAAIMVYICIYFFQINKLHLCKPLIRAIDSATIKDQFKLAHLVTYRCSMDCV